ncbi:uncharacterized protein L3040_005437 [Drepanopeziza brunnea f. sp. 'multigermtubi']|uniref:uncharacterized protein n=1 Tax=Drepanopeziza brunnea f. sp. 'multigermtubi' TaxID=698441 RepID=UPI002398D0EF|nr:hypothetical protein L3040_005437 [Drepanopeziza brunnea f. sp. 'multigermtubi']
MSIVQIPTRPKMCFYDSYVMACNCGKWGHFRQHCSKEYRTGETCGMKLVMNRYSKPEKCKICTKIDTKQRGIVKEEDKIRRWKPAHSGAGEQEELLELNGQLA